MGLSASWAVIVWLATVMRTVGMFGSSVVGWLAGGWSRRCGAVGVARVAPASGSAAVTFVVQAVTASRTTKTETASRRRRSRGGAGGIVGLGY